ncbi:Arm DNA-binding domain-containing protein [Antarcticimicrobium sediminis]|uniref:DUF4102 domain-containing protein n=1 Tax=Antarcticimicrobium sediminis TaxID=2546227 RepID=A0A4R5ELP6_9RHOB|nr:DUF4102 domain-containing protein [Antarcticimicrobium sediminis]
MRARNRLSAAFVKKAPIGKWNDGAGLWLVKREDGGAQWVLRVTVHGRRREMGLGGLPGVGLAEAHKAADRWRAVAAIGKDPIKQREAERRAARQENISLAALTAEAFEARKAELKDDGKAGRWMSPLENHVLPKLGKVPVTDVDQRDIRDTGRSLSRLGRARPVSRMSQVSPPRNLPTWPIHRGQSAHLDGPRRVAGCVAAAVGMGKAPAKRAALVRRGCPVLRPFTGIRTAGLLR